MDIDHDEEHAGAIGMDIAQQPAVIDVTHDALDALEGIIGMGGIVHGQHDAGQDHGNENYHRERTEIPEIVEIPGRRENAVFLIQHRDYRQAAVDPLYHRVLKFGSFATSHLVTSIGYIKAVQ